MSAQTEIAACRTRSALIEYGRRAGYAWPEIWADNVLHGRVLRQNRLKKERYHSRKIQRRSYERRHADN